MKNIIGIIFILSCLLIVNCEEGGNSVIGSKDHDIKSATAKEQAILANGIATTQIAVNVQNKKDKSSASGMKVHFKTTLGSIEQYGVTNSDGNAVVVLTSAASEIDLTAEITATVVDTNFTPLNKPMENHYAISISTPDFPLQKNDENSLAKAEQQLDNKATIYVKFLGVTFQAEIDETILPADGLSKAKINVKLRETTSQKAIKNAELQAFVNYGLIDGGTNTDDRGLAEFYLVADDQPGKDTLSVEYGNKLSRQFAVNYLIPNLTLTSKALQIPADGESTVEIVANLLSYKRTPIPGAEIRFSTSAGIIPELAATDNNGNAKANLIAGTNPDTNVVVIGRFHNLKDTVRVAFVHSIGVVPNSILLNADPNFIWVKETGNIDQTIISATVLGINNQPLGNDIKVKFFIINSPGSGEYIQPSSGNTRESDVIPTINGIAQATIRSGIKSGAVQIKAQLVDFPNIVSQTSNIVIRSGPAYMWVDPNNANNVIDHV
ncbi:MAG TPA: Ig-like domain-containing protein, partial [bacterium]